MSAYKVKNLQALLLDKLKEQDPPSASFLRDVHEVNKAAFAKNLDLLEIYAQYIDSDHSIYELSGVYSAVTRYSDADPKSLITEHGMSMRKMINDELGTGFFQNLNDAIAIMAMELTEGEVHQVIEITRRGILDVDKIRELLSAMSAAPSLGEGAL